MTGNRDARDENALVREVSRTAGRFLAANAGSPAGMVVFDVVVTTRWTLSDMAKAEVHALVVDLRLEYPHGLPRVRFVVDYELGEPYTVDPVEVSSATADEPSAPITDDEDDEDSDEDLMLLELGYRQFRFVNRISPADGWVSVSRSAEGTTTGFRFPVEATAIPGVPLIQVRNVAGTLSVRRTGREPRYLVSVNGTRVPAADKNGIRTRTSGTITIRESSGSAVAEIEFELHDRFADLRAGGATDLGDGDGIDAWIVNHAFTDHVRVAPPQRRSDPDLRGFTVGDGGRRKRLRVSVVYTEAVTIQTDPESRAERTWHVKMYRCDTPQDARLLREHLRTQADNVERANNAVGGSIRLPPWVIAPVHILALAQPRNRPITDLADSGDALAAGPDARLAGWFGVPDQPQRDCCVLVASPMLSHVGWPSLEYRRESPGVSSLERLAVLGKGLDRCHSLGFAHGDIKPDNVCRLVDADRPGYVLIDGDSILPITCASADTRLTDAYTSSATRRRKAEDREVDLRAHDRFCFALVVLTALASPERLGGLLVERGGGPRGIDSAEVVRDALANGWASRWTPFAAVLAEPFHQDVLADPDWSAEAWIGRLRERDDPRPPCGHDRCPLDSCVQVIAGDDVYDGPYAGNVRKIRVAVRAGNHVGERLRAEVLDRLREQQAVVAVSAYWLRFAAVSALVLALPLLFLVSVLVGDKP